MGEHLDNSRTEKTQEQITAQVGRIASKLLKRGDPGDFRGSVATSYGNDLDPKDRISTLTTVNKAGVTKEMTRTFEGDPVESRKPEGERYTETINKTVHVSGDAENPGGTVTVDQTHTGLDNGEFPLDRTQQVHAAAGMLSEVRGTLATREAINKAQATQVVNDHINEVLETGPHQRQ